MRTYLIDPHKKEVTEIDYDGDFKKIYTLIKANTFDVVRWASNVDIFIDDEGLLHGEQEFFALHNAPQRAYAGYGLVTGTDDEGETIACPWTLERVRSLVTFPSIRVKGFKPLPQGLTVERFGENMPLIGHTVEFEPKEEESKETQ